MLPSLRPREQMRSDLIGFLLYAIAEDPVESEVSFKEGKVQETGGGVGGLLSTARILSRSPCAVSETHPAIWHLHVAEDMCELKISIPIWSFSKGLFNSSLAKLVCSGFLRVRNLD